MVGSLKRIAWRWIVMNFNVQPDGRSHSKLWDTGFFNKPQGVGHPGILVYGLVQKSDTYKKTGGTFGLHPVLILPQGKLYQTFQYNR